MNNSIIFIDGENISPNNIEKLLNEIDKSLIISILRVYCDFSRSESKKWINICNNLNIEPIQVNHINLKNSVDIKMTVDIMNILYNNKNINNFIIISNDRDFRHIVSEIKSNNKTIMLLNDKKKENSINKIKQKKKMCESLKNDIINIINYFIKKKGAFNISLIKDILLKKYKFDNKNFNCSTMLKFLEKYFSDRYIFDNGYVYTKKK